MTFCDQYLWELKNFIISGYSIGGDSYCMKEKQNCLAGMALSMALRKDRRWLSGWWKGSVWITGLLPKKGPVHWCDEKLRLLYSIDNIFILLCQLSSAGRAFHS